MPVIRSEECGECHLIRYKIRLTFPNCYLFYFSVAHNTFCKSCERPSQSKWLSCSNLLRLQLLFTDLPSSCWSPIDLKLSAFVCHRTICTHFQFRRFTLHSMIIVQINIFRQCVHHAWSIVGGVQFAGNSFKVCNLWFNIYIRTHINTWWWWKGTERQAGWQ